MMTLIGLAITVAWGYSTLVALGLHGEVFFWELATLIDIMLLGHWIEMKSVLGASGALESLVRLMPAEAHLVGAGGATRDVPVAELGHGDRVLV
jgi:Cu2+-exporting ATPase